ncbi:hypothetical protein CDLVIII_2702 [Clostridium sp. DL-VIII]|uniref:hypothetical protein n=1 Tax=Clostridium sp. DL-VIII TaxID=641107 RepID=UPI00023AF928|nr:hypothetical protein [Clostridium sp. DL-VIII]EHI99302.1 hypothetical protein CDLVIII_2702 [Clostridium sp. DL-VIII]
MEVAIKSVGSFLLLYFSYYFLLRFIQSVFQGFIGIISTKLAKFLYAMSTPAHELAHLIVAILCLAKIEQVQLFPRENRPGFVRSRVKSSFPFLISIKEFLIAIAPVIINVPIFIFIESKFVLKGGVSELHKILDPRIMLTKEGIITMILFLILISGIAPSSEDFKGMIKGLIILCFIIFGFTYLSATFFNMRSVDFSLISIVILYYLEIIIAVLFINCILNYRKCLRITYMVIINALKHTLKYN